MLHLDAMTVTGKTLGENLEELKKNGFYEHCDASAGRESRMIGREIKRTDIIRSFDEPIGTNGSIAILRGNLAPEGCSHQAHCLPQGHVQSYPQCPSL